MNISIFNECQSWMYESESDIVISTPIRLARNIAILDFH